MVSKVTAAVAGSGALAELHARELPQKDNLCGPFWGALVLRAAGVGGVDQDSLAAQAGTTLPEGDPATFVPAGERSRQDYREDLPVADDSGTSGTAAPALAAALERLSEGRLAVVPVAAPVGDADAVTALLELAAETAPDTTLLANLRTGRLWGSRPDPALLLAYLAGADPDGPEPEWDVGHFVNLVACLRSGGRALVLVRDSYRSLGWNGYHLQPAHALAAALVRGDGREGGVLCVARAEEADGLRAALGAAGYELHAWDNGTPFSASP